MLLRKVTIEFHGPKGLADDEYEKLLDLIEDIMADIDPEECILMNTRFKSCGATTTNEARVKGT